MLSEEVQRLEVSILDRLYFEKHRFSCFIE